MNEVTDQPLVSLVFELVAAIALAIAVVAMLRVRALAKRLGEIDHGMMSLTDSFARLETDRARMPSVASPVAARSSQSEMVKGEGTAQRTDAKQVGGVTAIDPAVGSRSEIQRDPPQEKVAEPIQSVHVGESVQVPDADYTEEIVRKLYRDWCRERSRPRTTSKIEIASLQYDSQVDGIDGQRRHLLKDASQLAEFVRFSPKGEASGVVLPDPDAHFTPVVAYLFPGISRADYAQNERLQEQQPVMIRRYSRSQWEAM